MNNIAIQAINTSAKLQNTPILHDANVQFEAGRWTSIVGPNGAGKSTLLKVLAGVLSHEGSVELFGEVISKYFLFIDCFTIRSYMRNSNLVCNFSSPVQQSIERIIF